MERPKYILEIPADEYHAATKEGKYLSSHRLGTFRKCPLEYKQRCDGTILEKDTEAFETGRAAHVFVLEGQERFNEEFVVSDGPINPKTGAAFGKMTKAYQEWAAEQTVAVVSNEDFALIQKMNESVRGNADAARLLAEGFAEGTVRTEWDGEPIQTRMDWFNPETGDLVDFKTCKDLDKFRYDIRDYGYPFQLAYYANALTLAGYEKPVSCWLVVVEKAEPYRSAVFRLSESTIGDCNFGHMGGETWRDDNAAMIAELRKCRESGVWPTRYEGIVTI